MSTQTHLDALTAKHRDCEAQLADAVSHASSSDQEIAEIKHRKLQLKDEIAAIESRLRSSVSA
jgi:hypothetical protein